MKRSALSVAVVIAVALSAVASAQSGGAMGKGDKMKMNNKTVMTYTGCLEAGTAAGTFTLTHVVADDHMGKDMMKDGMKHDMNHDEMPADGMSHDAMMPSTLSLMGKAVRTSHVGRKVSVTGSLASSSFTVKSLKVVAASCS